MNRMRAPEQFVPRAINDRLQAAHLLRDARLRLAAHLDAADATGWALALRPDSKAAQRARIDWLLRSGQVEEAAALARGALRRDERDWRFWLRCAQALLAGERLEEAGQAIDQALTRRPDDRRVLLLAADIATRRGEHARALALLAEADERYPTDAAIARRLIDALLANQHIDEAAAVLEQLDRPEIDAAAKVLTAQGRLLDARVALEQALGNELTTPEASVLTLRLIDVLEASGDWPALRALARRSHADSAIAQRLTDACLNMGEFDRARSLMAEAHANTAEARHALTVLETIAGRHELALEALRSTRAQRTPAEPAQQLRPWLRAMLGMAVAEHMDARAARRVGADPSLSVLDGLLVSAQRTFEIAARESKESMVIDRCLADAETCRNALQGDSRGAQTHVTADAAWRQAA